MSKIFSIACADGSEFEVAKIDAMGKADINGEYIGLRWSKTRTLSCGYPTTRNGNIAYLLLPHEVAGIFVGSLLASKAKNKKSRKTKAFKIKKRKKSRRKTIFKKFKKHSSDTMRLLLVAKIKAKIKAS